MKKMMIPALLVLLPFVALAQVNLSGKVVNRLSAQPLPGASVKLMNTYYTVATNNAGTFEIKNLKTGIYTLIVSYLGYQNDTLHLNLQTSTSVTNALLPVAILQDEVIVLATRASYNTPVAYQSIEKKEMASANFGQDLPVLLSNSISSVSTSDAGNGMGYTALRIRGTDMTRINVTINGMPLNDPESHNVYWVDLPDFATSTDNIQIQRGVGTSTNGASAFGASINLQSSNLKTSPYAEYSNAFGSFNTLKNSASFGTGLINNHFSFDSRISILSSDGYIDRASSDLRSYYISGAYTSAKDLVRFNIFSGKEKTYQSWDGVPSDMLPTNRTYNGMGAYIDNYGIQRYYENETDNYTQTHYQAIYSHQVNGKIYLNASLHHTTGAGYYEQYRENDELSDYGIDAIRIGAPYYIVGTNITFTPDSTITTSDLIRQKHLANSFTGLTWSLNYHKNKWQTSFGGSWNTYTGNHFGRVIWTKFAGNSEINHEWYRSRAVKNDFNLYIKTEYDLTEKLHTWLDLQFRSLYYSINGIDDDSRNITQKHTFNFFNPKAGITYNITENQNIYTSLSVANREPNRDNFVDADPLKPAPTPETLYDAEMGYSVKTSKISLSANGYYMYYKQQLVLTGAINDVGSAVMVNVPVSYRAGIELSGRVMLSENLIWEPSLTLSHNKIKSYTEYIDNWDNWSQISVEHSNIDLAFSPSVIAGSKISYMLCKKLNLSLISKYVGKQFIDNTESNDRQLDSYFVNNFLISYTLNPAFMKEISFSLMVNNFMNEKYESNAWVYRYASNNTLQKFDGYFPQAGINFMTGITMKL